MFIIAVQFSGALTNRFSLITFSTANSCPEGMIVYTWRVAYLSKYLPCPFNYGLSSSHPRLRWKDNRNHMLF